MNWYPPCTTHRYQLFVVCVADRSVISFSLMISFTWHTFLYIAFTEMNINSNRFLFKDQSPVTIIWPLCLWSNFETWWCACRFINKGPLHTELMSVHIVYVLQNHWFLCSIRGGNQKLGVGTSISRYTDQIKNVNLNIKSRKFNKETIRFD